MNRSQRLDRDLLDDILSACDSVEKFIAGISEEAFLGSDLLQSAVLAKITLIGEAASHITAMLRESHPGVPWRQVISMRHRMVHDYRHVDWSLVWRTAINDLPRLKQQVSAIVASLL